MDNFGGLVVFQSFFFKKTCHFRGKTVIFRPTVQFFFSGASFLNSSFSSLIKLGAERGVKSSAQRRLYTSLLGFREAGRRGGVAR